MLMFAGDEGLVTKGGEIQGAELTGKTGYLRINIIRQVL